MDLDEAPREEGLAEERADRALRAQDGVARRHPQVDPARVEAQILPDPGIRSLLLP